MQPLCICACKKEKKEKERRKEEGTCHTLQRNVSFGNAGGEKNPPKLKTTLPTPYFANSSPSGAYVCVFSFKKRLVFFSAWEKSRGVFPIAFNSFFFPPRYHMISLPNFLAVQSSVALDNHTTASNLPFLFFFFL